LERDQNYRFLTIDNQSPAKLSRTIDTQKRKIMRRILPSLVVILFLVGMAALLTMPLETNSSSDPMAQVDAETAWAAFEKWRVDQKPEVKTQQELLEKLENKFPNSYRFSIEQLRGKEQQAAIKEDAEKLSILAKAGLKALASKESAALLKELKMAKNDRENGFGLISAKYKTNWKKIEQGIAKKDQKALQRFLPAQP
jgi:hypothetical protein